MEVGRIWRQRVELEIGKRVGGTGGLEGNSSDCT